MNIPKKTLPELPYGSIAAGYDDNIRWFERRFFAPRRRLLIPKAEGDVLEIGAGTGVNLRYYQGARSLTLTDPDPLMLKQAEAKPRPEGFDVNFDLVGAETLPYGNESFDTVVATLAFCTIERPDRALAEIRRVLRPGGKLLMLEHVRPPSILGISADVLTPIQKRLCGGCRLNRRTVETVEDTGFALQRVERSGYGILAVIEAIR